MKFLTVILVKEKLIPLGPFPDKKIFPGIKLLKGHVLPVIKACAPHGLLRNIEAVRFNENELKVKSDASAPDTPGITGNLRRKQYDFKLWIIFH